jgi:hypothetical protein
MIKKFNDVSNDTEFKINDMQYKKVATVKISCCKSINAIQVDNPRNRIFIQPQTDVEVND